MDPFRTVAIVIVVLVIIIFILACMVLLLASKPEANLWSLRASYVFWPAQLSACTAYAHCGRRS
jgi:hypothetical protein